MMAMEIGANRLGAIVVAAGPPAVWGMLALLHPAHLGAAFLALTTAAAVPAALVPRNARRVDRLLAFTGSALASLATVIGLVISFLLVLRFDACLGNPDQATQPLYATVTAFTVIPIVYAGTAWLLLGRGHSPLWLPLATIAAWAAASIAYVLFAFAGYPHHCYT